MKLLLRFTNAYPSSFSFPERDDFKENAKKNFSRQSDNSQFSFWEKDNNDFVIAYRLISKDSKPDKLPWIKLEYSFFESNNFVMNNSRDMKAPNCICNLHYLVYLPDSTLDVFINALQKYLISIPFEDRLSLISKKDFKNFLESKSQLCTNETQKLELKKWVEELLAK